MGADGLIIDRNQLQTYECDGLGQCCEGSQQAVVLPRCEPQTQAIVRICARGHTLCRAQHQAPGFQGERCPIDRGIVISFARMTRFLATDIPNQRIGSMPTLPNGPGRPLLRA